MVSLNNYFGPLCSQGRGHDALSFEKCVDIVAYQYLFYGSIASQENRLILLPHQYVSNISRYLSSINNEHCFCTQDVLPAESLLCAKYIVFFRRYYRLHNIFIRLSRMTSYRGLELIEQLKSYT